MVLNCIYRKYPFFIYFALVFFVNSSKGICKCLKAKRFNQGRSFAHLSIKWPQKFVRKRKAKGQNDLSFEKYTHTHTPIEICTLPELILPALVIA